MQYQTKKYIKEINKLDFEKQWDYVQKKLVSLNNVDIKFKESILFLESFFFFYNMLANSTNIAIGEESSFKLLCNDNIDKYFVCDSLRCVNILYSRLSDKIYKGIIPIKGNEYIISILPLIEVLLKIPKANYFIFY